MNLYQKFKVDLDHSAIYEIYTKTLFEEIGWQFIQYNTDKDYDIMMYNKQKEVKLIEVKSDNKSFYTPNVVFEYESYGKPSGIKATKADYWVHILPSLGEVWFIKVPQLRQIIKAYNPEVLIDSPDCWSPVQAGDGKNTKCYKWNRKSFAKVMGKDLKIIKRFDIP
jgi:hypothetical protein